MSLTIPLTANESSGTVHAQTEYTVSQAADILGIPVTRFD